MNPARMTRPQLALLTLLLLIVAASRMFRLMTFELHHDEVWSVWQTMGSPAQIIQWTPFDWAPGYYLTLGGWRLLMGMNPIVLRFMSVLFSLLTMALLYRIGKRLTGQHMGGVVAFLVYAVMGFSLYQSVILRGYSMLIFFSALAFWLLLRYFNRPTLLRGVLLGSALAAMLYTHYSAAFAFIAFGLYTLVVMPRRLVRWVLPVVVLAILNIPQLPKQINYLLAQTNFGEKPPPIAALENLRVLFIDFTGEAWWLVLLALGLAAIFYLRARRASRPMLALGLWALAPLLLYISPNAAQIFTDPVASTYLPRYFWWLTIPFVGWIALGMSHAPRLVSVVTSGLLVAGLLLPIPTRYQENVPPLMTSFSWLSHEALWGDVILVDPQFPERESAYQWQYFSLAYFPSGIAFVDAPGDHRRVWHLSVEGQQDPATFEALRRDYVAGDSLDMGKFIVRLFESPPDRMGVLFENGMRFHGMDIVGAREPATTSYREGETIQTRLWWSVDAPVPLDYSVGVYLMDSQYSTRAQNSGAPTPIEGPHETSRWEAGRYYVDQREILLPSQILSQDLALYLSVDQWWDGQRVSAVGVNNDQLLPLATFDIQTWWVPSSRPSP